MPDSPPLPTILVVDDTEAIRELLMAGLGPRGFRVLTADGGKAMDAILRDTRIDLIVLDSMMPVEDGPSICARLTQAGNGPPIIMLSAGATDTAIWGPAPPAPPERMMSAELVARAIVDAVATDPRGAVEEIVLRPPLGDL